MVSEDKRLNEVIRVQKRTNNFVMIDKGFLENMNLSWKAKGILAYLLSKPDNWKVIVGNIINQATDGKTAVYNGLKELSEQGHYVKRPIRNEQGNRIVQWESIVFEIPEDGKTLDITDFSLLPDFQEIENLDIGNLNIENQPLVINNNTKNYKTLVNNQSSLSVGTDGQDKTETIIQRIEACTEMLKSNIGYDSFAISRPSDIGLIDEIIGIMLDVVVSSSPSVAVGGENKPRELVKHNLMQLGYDDIELVLDQFKSQSERITKKKQYILTMLYNSKLERHSHYANWVESEMRGGKDYV